MVRASKDRESEYPGKVRRDEREGVDEEESLTAYYMRQQGTPNRNEVIPTWRKPPADRNAEPEAFGHDSGKYGPKATNWDGQSSPTEDFREGQDCNPSAQNKPEPGNVPSHSRNFGRGFKGAP